MIIPFSDQKFRLTSVTVFIAIVLVIWQWLIGSLSGWFQLFFFAVAIFTFGIPHGALDHLVEQEAARRRNSTFNIIIFLFKYLALMAFYAVLWYFFPEISFVLFIIISSWHFGETDIDYNNNKKLLGLILKFFYGLCLLTWLLLSH